MTWFEVVAAVWICAVAGTATLSAWTAAVIGLDHVAQVRFAADCAEDAAERYWAHGHVPASYTRDGLVCAVTVVQHGGNGGGQTHIVARVGEVVQQLWVADRFPR